jgi:hypothetical protein
MTLKKTPLGVSAYQRLLGIGVPKSGNPPLGIGITSPGKKGSSGIREHGFFRVQRFLGAGSSGIREQGFFRVQRFFGRGTLMKSPPPGPDTQGFASAEVLPVMLTAVASIRGRTNSLVIISMIK